MRWRNSCLRRRRLQAPSPDHRFLVRAEVAGPRQLGLRVVPCTVNNPADMVRLIGWGVDGVRTDRPDIGRELMDLPMLAQT